MLCDVEQDWTKNLRLSAERYLQQMARAHLDNLSGRETAVPLMEIHEEHPELSSNDTFVRLEEEIDRASSGRRHKRLQMLRELVGTNIERLAAAPSTSRRLELEASLTVELDGRSVPFRSLPVSMSNCRDPSQRDALLRVLITARREVSSLAEESLNRARDGAEATSGLDYIGWRSHLSRYDIDELASDGEELLSQTDDMALESLQMLLRGRVASRSGNPTTIGDLWFAQRAMDLDSLVPPDELWRIDEWLSRWGIDSKAEGRVIRDVEQRPSKSARAFCVPVRVPEEIHLIVTPTGGLPQWRGLLHELGHALHLAHVDPNRAFEDRRLGDLSVTEGWAVLIDHLMMNRLWLRKVLRLSPPDADLVTRASAATSLLITRRNTASLLIERALYRNDPATAEIHEELHRRATGVPPFPEGIALDIDPELYCSRYVRAWLFEGLAHQVLRERFDEDWFLNPRAAAHLLELFSEGQARDLHEISEESFGAPLTTAPLVRRYEEVLG